MESRNKVVSVTMQRVADSRVWVAVCFSLSEKDYTPGDYFVAYSENFCCTITPLDEEAARAFKELAAEDAVEAAAEGEEYVCGWGGYIAQGTRQGFRLRKTPDRRVIVHRMEGCLGLDGDAEGIIWAATLGIMLLLGGDGSHVETPGWIVTKYSID